MIKLLIPIIALFILLTSCENNKAKQKEDTSNKNLKVFAVNYPLQFFAERIGRDKIDLMDLIPEDVDPAYWMPVQELNEIQSSDLILTNGANYAKWLEKVSLPSSKMVNTSEGAQDMYIKIQEGETHSHGAGGDHVHYGFAFTTWLDFEIASLQAKAVMKAFIKKRPQHKEYFTSNYNKLKIELDALNKSMKTVANNIPDKHVFGSHPVYQYLGQAYGIDIISEHWEPSEVPDDKQWEEFILNFEYYPSQLMMWEGEPNETIRNQLQKLGMQSIVFNPCSNKPSNGDFLSVMNQNIRNLEKYIDEN